MCQDDTNIAYRDGWNAAMSTKTKTCIMKLEKKMINGVGGYFPRITTKCSACNIGLLYFDSNNSFCPNCGAKITEYVRENANHK
jgi:PHP family Zn ribbon phosphoesterase